MNNSRFLSLLALIFVAQIYLGRRLLSILTTVYIPTIILNIIGHITNYFKPFYFESAIAVNITVMLVLVSMYIAVVASLPVTSYIKMIEIWLLFNLIIPFIDVCICCYVDYIRTNLEEENNNASTSSVEDEKKKDDNNFTFEDLVHNDELIQDSALKDYYAKATVKDETQRKIMNACIFFSRTIKPIIILIFVCIYWGSGLIRTFQIE